MSKQHKLKTGDSVVVKPGALDPDLGGNIGGWQGRITGFEKYEGQTMVSIAWDSLTLKSIPRSVIEHCEEEGLDWRVMNLGEDEVEPANARDREKDAARVAEKIRDQLGWIGPDEEDKRIQKVLAGLRRRDLSSQLKAWDKYLEKTLAFPFEAEIAECWSGPFEGGERVIVQTIADLDEHYGIIVQVEYEGETFHLPLCDLEGTKKKSANYLPVKDYAVWFANR
jgi:hypothetical protein